MTLERFIDQRASSWSALQSLVDQAKGKADRLEPDQLKELGLLYRKAAGDLAIARRRYPATTGTTRLDALVTAAHALVYAKPKREDRISTFFTQRFWERVREGGVCLLLSVGLLVAAGVLGFIWSVVNPVASSGILPAGFHATTHPGQGGVVGIAIPARTGLAFEIFTNNIEVAILALAGGFTLGLLTAYVLVTNGALIGVLAGLEWKAGAWEAFTRLVIPHGVLELSCIAVAGSAGFQITRALVDPGHRRRSVALQTIAPRLADTLLGVAACLVLAGLTEGIVTTWDLPIGGGAAIGLGWGVLFWGLVIWRRPKRDVARPATDVPVRSVPAAST
jgi:uncharacterized membrane protein SpoIIM required for sporulation